MAEPIISFIPENDDAFRKALDDVRDKVQDFTIPFSLIANDFYRSNRKLFSLKSGGLYPPYGGFSPFETVFYRGTRTTKKDRAENEKLEKFGFIFPMLKRTGKLETSLSGKSAPGAEFFVGRSQLIMGTKVDYAKYHQSDRPRTKLPQRKMIFIDGGPAERAKDASISGRRERWINILNDYVAQVVSGDAGL